MSEAKRPDFATSKFWPILWFQAFFGTIATPVYLSAISFEIIHKNTNQNLLFWFFGFLSLAELFFEH